MNKIMVNKLFLLFLITSGLSASYNNVNNSKGRSRIGLTQEEVNNFLSRMTSQNYSPTHSYTNPSFNNFKNKINVEMMRLKKNQKNQQESILLLNDQLIITKKNVSELEENTRYIILKNKDTEKKLFKKIHLLSRQVRDLKSKNNKFRFGSSTTVFLRQCTINKLRNIVSKPYKKIK